MPRARWRATQPARKTDGFCHMLPRRDAPRKSEMLRALVAARTCMMRAIRVVVAFAFMPRQHIARRDVFFFLCARVLFRQRDKRLLPLFGLYCVPDDAPANMLFIQTTAVPMEDAARGAYLCRVVCANHCSAHAKKKTICRPP